jgi:hypothetical protein
MMMRWGMIMRGSITIMMEITVSFSIQDPILDTIGKDGSQGMGVPTSIQDTIDTINGIGKSIF